MAKNKLTPKVSLTFFKLCYSDTPLDFAGREASELMGPGPGGSMVHIVQDVYGLG